MKSRPRSRSSRSTGASDAPGNAEPAPCLVGLGSPRPEPGAHEQTSQGSRQLPQASESCAVDEGAFSHGESGESRGTGGDNGRDHGSSGGRASALADLAPGEAPSAVENNVDEELSAKRRSESRHHLHHHLCNHLPQVARVFTSLVTTSYHLLRHSCYSTWCPSLVPFTGRPHECPHWCPGHPSGCPSGRRPPVVDPQ